MPVTEESFYKAQVTKFRTYAAEAGIEENDTNLGQWDVDHNLSRIRDYYQEKHGTEAIYQLGLSLMYRTIWYNAITVRIGTARDGKPVTMLTQYGPKGSKGSIYTPVSSTTRQAQIQQQLGIIERATVRLRALELPLAELRQRIEEFYLRGEE
jgi:hypothetical protein